MDRSLFPITRMLCAYLLCKCGEVLCLSSGEEVDREGIGGHEEDVQQNEKADEVFLTRDLIKCSVSVGFVSSRNNLWRVSCYVVVRACVCVCVTIKSVCGIAGSVFMSVLLNAVCKL